MYEDENTFVLKLIHGTQSIDNQILSAISLSQTFPELQYVFTNRF